MATHINNNDSVLVVGSDGTIGQRLVLVLQTAGKNVLQTTHHRSLENEQKIFLDLSEDMVQWTLPPEPIKIAVLCAAVTSLKMCHINPDYSRKVNVNGTFALAKRLVDSGSFVVFISSNLVFDGQKPFAKPTDPVNPLTEYGRQKVETESLLAKLENRVSIVRFSKVFNADSAIFHDWIRVLKAGKEIHPFFDMVMSPIPLDFAVDVLFKVAMMQIPGIMQVSAAHDISYAEAALRIAKKLGLDEKLINPVSYRETGIEFAPLHTTLNVGRLHSELGLIPPEVFKTITVNYSI